MFSDNSGKIGGEDGDMWSGVGSWEDMDAQFIVLFKERGKTGIQEALDASVSVPRTPLEQISKATKR